MNLVVGIECTIRNFSVYDNQFITGIIHDCILNKNNATFGLTLFRVSLLASFLFLFYFFFFVLCAAKSNSLRDNDRH